jgi:hypothetical protein
MWQRPVGSKKFWTQIELFRAVGCEALPVLAAGSARCSSCLSWGGWSGFSFPSCRPELGVVLWLFYLSLLFFSLFSFSVHLPILRLQSPRCNLPNHHVSRTWPPTHTHTNTLTWGKSYDGCGTWTERRKMRTLVSFLMFVPKHVRPLPASLFHCSSLLPPSKPTFWSYYSFKTRRCNLHGDARPHTASVANLATVHSSVHRKCSVSDAIIYFKLSGLLYAFA